MEKLHFSIKINAPKEKVWNTMLGDKTYQEWTSVFAPGSSYEGSWDEGSEIHFIDPASNQGMFSVIKENKPYEFISIKHLGEIQNGEKKEWYDEKMQGGEFLENYTFNEVDGGTEVLVDMDIVEEYKEMMAELWPKALEKLKEIAEK
jgi:L-rhamnose mutarotase